MTMAHRLRRLLWRAGIDVRRVGDVGPARILIARDVDLVLDVGANDGGYGAGLRLGGYRGRLWSFEPGPAAYARLARRVRGDRDWSATPLALGAEAGTAQLRLAANEGHSSSLLAMLPRHLDAAPDVGVAETLAVEVRRLDEVAVPAVTTARRPFAKLDVQGSEAAVLDGAAGILDRLVGVQVELSLVPLYDGAATAAEVTDRVEAMGMKLVGLEPGFVDPATGELLQYDAIFMRT